MLEAGKGWRVDGGVGGQTGLTRGVGESASSALSHWDENTRKTNCRPHIEERVVRRQRRERRTLGQTERAKARPPPRQHGWGPDHAGSVERKWTVFPLGLL